MDIEPINKARALCVAALEVLEYYDAHGEACEEAMDRLHLAADSWEELERAGFGAGAPAGRSSGAPQSVAWTYGGDEHHPGPDLDALDLQRPVIVCLCGSTRFWRTFQEAGLKETLAGKIVLSIGAASGTDDEHFGNLPREEYNRVKAMLDELHLRKIERADEVLILNVDGYIGPSTSRELVYARKLGKRIRFWESTDATDQPPH
jgi:hypothetical protein